MGERVQNEGIDGTIGTGDIKESTAFPLCGWPHRGFVLPAKCRCLFCCLDGRIKSGININFEANGEENDAAPIFPQ
ncbi:hypothetical protein JCM14450A_00810 [Geobacillus stearothermophilus]